MHTRWAVVPALVAVAVTLAACGSGTNGGTRGAGAPRSTSTSSPPSSNTTTPSVGTTTPTNAAALSASLTTAATAEGNALATYQAVVAQLGAIAPFTNVASSEQQHLTAVQTVASHYGLTVSSGPFSASPVPSTKTAACQLGVTIEQGVVATYDQLMGQVAAYADVTSVFTTLQQAAQDDHLPAFERCA